MNPVRLPFKDCIKVVKICAQTLLLVNNEHICHFSYLHFIQKAILIINSSFP